MPILTISCGVALRISRPSKRTLPTFGWLIPWIVRSVVDLPAPLAPISVTISPWLTVSETPLIASIRP